MVGHARYKSFMIVGHKALRGLVKVRGEFSLKCLVHNVKKIWC